jgi:hypothetical protein
MSAELPELAAIEPWLGDLRRALDRDRSHALVICPPGPEAALLLRALPRFLLPALRAVGVSLALADADELADRILAALGEPPGGESEAYLLAAARELSEQGSALALLVEDAAALPAESLQRLGELAAAARPGLRVAFFADAAACDAASLPHLVQAFGLGVQKIVLAPGPGDAVARPRGASAPPTLQGVGGAAAPPAAPAGTSADGAPRPYPRPAVRSRRPAALAAAAGVVLLAGLGAVLAPGATPLPSETRSAPQVADVALGPQLRRVALPEPKPAQRQAAATAALAPAPPAEVAEVATAPAPPAEVAEVATAPAAPRVEPAAPPPRVRPQRPVRRVAVNLNARPWARVEVDGRELGLTPLANVRLAPGAHRFRARLPDGRVVERVVRVDAYRTHITFP